LPKRESSRDNALAETINGLYKAEVIHRRWPWRSFEAVEYATSHLKCPFKCSLGRLPPSLKIRFRQ
jgi:transposase InsO family protein